MIDGAEAGERFSLVEHPMSPRALAAPVHRHTREDEYSYVLSGRMGALLGDDVVEAGPGDLVHKPRNQWHTFWNAGDEPCRILEIISPAGFEVFFRELSAWAASRGGPGGGGGAVRPLRPRDAARHGAGPRRALRPPAGRADVRRLDALTRTTSARRGAPRPRRLRQAARLADMSEYDRNFWEERWSQALREHEDRIAQRPPNARLTAELGDLRPGRALDAGCGHGSDTLWLAARGWRVTAVDFAATALAQARSTAEALGPDVAERIDWVEADLATWTPRRDGYDLVVCLYVHVAGSVEELVQRLATGVAPGGTLFLVGHLPVDPATGAATAAAGQRQVSVEAARAALDPDRWELVVAEDRPRPSAGTGVDAVIRARRR